MTSSVVNWFKGQSPQFIFLLLLLIFLPLFEAPKNIFAFFFVLSFFVVAIKEKKWGGSWRIIDTIFLLFLLANIVITINAIMVHKMPGSIFNDLTRFVLVAWVISRCTFESRRIIALCMAAIISTMVALAYSYIICPQGGVCVELNSVGHVNHSAIYLVICYGISLPLLLFNYSTLTKSQKIILLFSIVFLSYSIVDTDSRAASGLWLFITFFNFCYTVFHLKNLKLSLVLASFLLLISSLLVYSPPSVVNKFQSGSDLFGPSHREQIRAFSYYAFKSNPLLGIGFGNFILLDHNDIKDAVIDHVGVFVKEKFSHNAHPHNLYYNYLVSGGIVLFSVFTWFWIYIIIILWRAINKYRNQWLVLCSANVILITLGIGWVNTTLTHEHALLAVFVLGLLISKDRGPKYQKPTYI